MFKALFSKQGLSIDRLHNFLLVVECGSIAEAADREPSRQSLLSRQIRELEVFFEVELTRRKGKGIEITEAGQKLAECVRGSFNSLEDFLVECQGGKKRLKIGAGFSTLQWMVAPKSGQISELLNAELEMIGVRSREVEQQLIGGELDLAVVRADAIDSGDKRFEIVELGGCGYSLFRPSGSKLPLAVPAGDGQLAGVLRDVLADAFAERIYCNTLLQATGLVMAEQACAVLPDMACVVLARMDWIQKEPFDAMRNYRREWVLAASKRQLELRGIDQSEFRGLAQLLKV